MKKAFTLVELLVVVTIIVILIALLAPAMDKAIYQAELAVCGTQLKQITTAATTGALDYQRKYPDRAGLFSPHMLTVGNGVDTRVQMKDYLGDLNTLLACPFHEAVDLENSSSSNHAYGTYYLWFGWRHEGGLGGPGMMRLGDRWTWDKRKYSVFAHDMDVVGGISTNWSSHPDRDSVLYYNRLQDMGGYTLTTWQVADNQGVRGETDLNFAYMDGGVRRIDDVMPSDPVNMTHDERMAITSNWRNNGTSDLSSWATVPRE